MTKCIVRNRSQSDSNDITLETFYTSMHNMTVPGILISCELDGIIVSGYVPNITDREFGQPQHQLVFLFPAYSELQS